MLFSFPLELFQFQFPFPLVAQNYSHSHGNPMGMGIPMGIPWEWEFPCTPLVWDTRHMYCMYSVGPITDCIVCLDCLAVCMYVPCLP